MPLVVEARRLGDQELDRLAEQLTAGVAGEALHQLVGVDDPAAPPNDDDAVGKGLEQRFEPLEWRFCRLRHIRDYRRSAGKVRAKGGLRTLRPGRRAALG